MRENRKIYKWIEKTGSMKSTIKIKIEDLSYPKDTHSFKLRNVFTTNYVNKVMLGDFSN